MKNIVSNLYADYLRYTDRFRAIPWEVDLLKPVERRVLLSVHEVARTKLTKAAKVTGSCLANYHPHGDLSTYEVLVSLVQNGLVEGQGNWGNDNVKDYIKAASPRYTECKAVAAVDDGFSEFLNFIPWEEFEYENEPHYLPFYLPIGLIGYGVIQGISLHTTKIPRYQYQDLLTRLYELVTNAPVKTIIKPAIFQNDIFEDTDNQFEKILTIGEGVLYCIPKYKIIDNAIHIYGKNPISGFNKLDAFNEKYEETNGKPYAIIIDSSDSKLEVIVSPPKRVTITQKFISEIMDLVSCKLHVNCNVVTEKGTVKQKGIDNLLLNTYNKWKLGFNAKLNNDLQNLLIKEHELNIVLVIRNIIQQHPGVNTLDDICKHNTSNFTKDELLSIMKKYTIRHLIEAKIDIPELQKKIQSVKNDIRNLDTIALERIKSCRK